MNMGEEYEDLYDQFPPLSMGDLEGVQHEQEEEAQRQGIVPRGDYRCQIVVGVTKVKESEQSSMRGYPVTRLQLNIYKDDGTRAVAFVDASGTVVKTPTGRTAEASQVGIALSREMETIGHDLPFSATLKALEGQWFCVNLGTGAVGSGAEQFEFNRIRFSEKKKTLPGFKRLEG